MQEFKEKRRINAYYRLTLAAETDLADILEYGEAYFGTSAALEFYVGLLSVSPKIVDDPAQFSELMKCAKNTAEQLIKRIPSIS